MEINKEAERLMLLEELDSLEERATEILKALKKRGVVCEQITFEELGLCFHMLILKES